MFAQTITVAVTTGTNGTGLATSDVIQYGVLNRVQYVKTDFDDGSTFNITLSGTGETIWNETAVNASTVRSPRIPTHTTAGAASLYAAGGTAVNDKIAIVNDKISVSVTSGGSAKSGTFKFILT